jgi:hypothetical protein
MPFFAGAHLPGTNRIIIAVFRALIVIAPLYYSPAGGFIQ